MTPKEKAKEIFCKFRRVCTDMHGFTSKSDQKRAAIIAVDEILTVSNELNWSTRTYWEEVKDELEYSRDFN